MSPPRFVVLALALSVTALVTVPIVASAQQRLDATVAASVLASPGKLGGGAMAGVRWGIGPRFAVSFDVGYGVLAGAQELQDRWWLMPSVAVVLPVGGARVELGVGFGFGETSGFRYERYFADRPDWSFQLVPEVRGHVAVSASGSDLFVRIDVASVLLEGNEIGLREGDPAEHGIADTVWLAVSFGTRFRLL